MTSSSHSSLGGLPYWPTGQFQSEEMEQIQTRQRKTVWGAVAKVVFIVAVVVIVVVLGVNIKQFGFDSKHRY